MSTKAFRFCRIVIAAAIVIGVGISALINNALIALAVVVTGMGLMFLCRMNYKGVTSDERFQRISEKASRLTIAIFGPVVAVTSVLLLMLCNGSYPDLKPVAYTMAYLASALTMLYLVFYVYYERKN